MPLTYSKAIFQQDNGTPQTASVTRYFLKIEGIVTCNWSALSPDLNPIENIWALIKAHIRKRQDITNIESLC
jgi:hypothetical protein